VLKQVRFAEAMEETAVAVEQLKVAEEVHIVA